MKHRRIQTWVVLLMAAVALDLAGCGGGGGGGGGGGRPGVNVTRVGGGGGAQGLGGGFGASHPSLSQDGRYVAFEADFTNLVAGDTNNVADIFVFDQVSKTTVRVSIPDGAAPGAQGNGDSTEPAITPDGRYVAFNSNATNLIATDTNLASDVYVRDTNLLNPRTVRMSVGDGVPGTQANSDSYIAGNAVAVDTTVNVGNVLVAFYSFATNLFPALDNNGSTHVYLRSCSTDFVTCTTVPVDNTGVQGNGDSLDPSVSKNGRFVVYTSRATNLVAGDTNASADIFVFDRQAGGERSA